MEYEIKSCLEEEADCFAEKYDDEIDLLIPPCPESPEERIVFKITDEADRIIGGCVLHVDRWMIASISNLWVDGDFRGQGLGSALIRRAERFARARKCYLATLGTYDFQARSFYEKHGYTVCGTIRDWPRGHENYFMEKRLDRAAGDSVPSGACTKQTYGIRYGSEEDADIIDGRLEEYDNSWAPREHGYISVEKKVLDKEGSIIAVCTAGVGGWNCAKILFIWVEEPYRNQGIGSRLLRATEREAMEAGGYIAFTGVFEWQTAFFEKNGYTVCGRFADCPRGHSWILLDKRF